MTNDESNQLLYERVMAHIKDKDLAGVIAAEVVARIDDTSRLNLQIKYLWVTLIAVFILITATAIAGCAKPEVNKCTYICPKGKSPPIGCYCIEDEIDKEANHLSHP